MNVIGSLAGIGVALMVLAGCSPTPTAGPTSSHSVRPTPTPSLAAAPVPALPLDCAQLFTIGAVQSHLQDSVSTKVDETHTGTSLEDLALLQAGGTECTWGGEDMTDSSYDTGVVLTILPDAASDFGGRTLSTSGTTVSGTLGASSAYDCGNGGGGWCFGDVLAGGYWISFQVGDANAPTGPTNATVEAIMKPIAQAVSSAGGSVIPWAKPSASFDGAALCTAPDAQALVSSAMGTAVTPQDIDQENDILTVAARRSGVTGCSWASGPDSGIGIEVLPGGSWVYPRVAAAPPLWTLIGHPTAVDVSGSEGALVGCGDHCESLVVVRNSLVHLSIGDVLDDAAATAITQKLVAGIPAS